MSSSSPNRAAINNWSSAFACAQNETQSTTFSVPTVRLLLTNAGVDTATAAARRRQRRLRSWLRHERMTVAMLLAERDHHTAPWGQKQARSGGVEREVNHEPRLLDPPLLQEAATVGYVAAPVPLQAQPVLGGGDTLDVAAVQFSPGAVSPAAPER